MKGKRSRTMLLRYIKKRTVTPFVNSRGLLFVQKNFLLEVQLRINDTVTVGIVIA